MMLLMLTERMCGRPTLQRCPCGLLAFRALAATAEKRLASRSEKAHIEYYSGHYPA